MLGWPHGCPFAPGCFPIHATSTTITDRLRTALADGSLPAAVEAEAQHALGATTVFDASGTPAATAVTYKIERSWGPEYCGEVQYLRVWVSRLRKTLLDGADETRPAASSRRSPASAP